MTTNHPSIVIPDELRPSDGRFGSGPSKVPLEALEALAATGTTYLGTSHRRNGIRSVVGRLRKGLGELFRLPAGYEVVLGNGGATGFWDAAAFGLIERHSQHLVFGEFSSKFASVASAAPHIDAHIIESETGTHPRVRADPGVDLYALTHNETSTGVMAPIERPEAGGLVAVDATSAAGALRVDAAAFDVYYFSPQKAFAADGGLWAALCSPAAVDRIGSMAGSGRWIPPTLDLSIALANSRKNQTYNTPGLATIFLFSRQVDWLLDRGGLEWAADRCDRSSTIVYDWVDESEYATPFVGDPAQRSRTVATIDFAAGVSADLVAGVLRDNGIVDLEGYRKLGRNQLRVALFPAIDPDDVERLTRAVDYVVEQL